MEKKNLSKPRKSTVKKIKTDKKVDRKKKQKPLPVSTTLLLSYVYSINENYSKLIAVGFDPNTFIARFILNDVDNDKILIDSDEWYLLFGKQNSINEAISKLKNETSIEEHEKSSLIVLSETLMISIEKLDKIKICQRCNISNKLLLVSLTLSEWNQLNNLMEFLNIVVTYNRSCTPLIKMYFDLYVERCNQQGKSVLDSADYFFFYEDINNNNIKINYSRLFNEIPLLCKVQIENRLLQNSNNVI